MVFFQHLPMDKTDTGLGMKQFAQGHSNYKAVEVKGDLELRRTCLTDLKPEFELSHAAIRLYPLGPTKA